MSACCRRTSLARVWRAAGDDDYGRIVRLLKLTGQRRDEIGGMAEVELERDGLDGVLPPARGQERPRARDRAGAAGAGDHRRAPRRASARVRTRAGGASRAGVTKQVLTRRACRRHCRRHQALDNPRPAPNCGDRHERHRRRSTRCRGRSQSHHGSSEGRRRPAPITGPVSPREESGIGTLGGACRGPGKRRANRQRGRADEGRSMSDRVIDEYEVLYLQTGNPLYAWQALSVCRRDEPLPGWVFDLLRPGCAVRPSERGKQRRGPRLPALHNGDGIYTCLEMPRRQGCDWRDC